MWHYCRIRSPASYTTSRVTLGFDRSLNSKVSLDSHPCFLLSYPLLSSTLFFFYSSLLLIFSFLFFFSFSFSFSFFFFSILFDFGEIFKILQTKNHLARSSLLALVMGHIWLRGMDFCITLLSLLPFLLLPCSPIFSLLSL